MSTLLFVIFTSDDRNTIIGRSGAENIHIGQALASIGGGGHAGSRISIGKKQRDVTSADQGTDHCGSDSKQNRECPYL